MTAIALPATEARTTTPTRTRRGAGVRHFAHYLLHSWLMTLRDWSFLAFIMAMPVTIYLFFAGIYGDQLSQGGVEVAAIMMVTMATYGALGAAMSAGNQITNERSTGWFRQLMVTALSPTQFIVAKVLVAIGVVIPAIVVVFLAGAVRGVRMPVETWLASGSLVLLSLLPMVILGLTLGLWLKPAAAGAATTLVMLALSMLGGLWFPLEMMPEAMQTVGKLLPSYWAGRIGTWPLVGGDFPTQGVLVIGTWAVVLVGLGALGYGRAVRTSRR
ncbi:ABC transporter permease [Propioniciclava sp. MC1683]|jgi:ABC-2 type transport system permease protein|uniref:ABC transporter permease n=1 Tax=Propioniciclava sp. MC1683 TaxID=2760309 RepID=UPI001603A310|nr:ABC transporter permease [Propioniciclava sp. MC1683]MBB1500349.1 ABC transporter permease [Propioniciclava sp. MC1683]